MPEISRFYGIVVGMFYNDHGRPHFHARYGRERISIYLPDLEVRTGGLPPRALRLLIEWAAQHREELMEDWDLARLGKPLKRIRPLQ